MDAKIADLLCSRADEMSWDEVRMLRQVLNIAISGLDAEVGLPSDPRRLQAVRAIQSSLFRLRNFAAEVPPDGILWSGRPPFMTDALLAEMQAKARELAAHSVRNGRHTFTECPSLLASFPQAELEAFLRTAGRGLVPTGKLNFQYYSAPGEGVGAHVDIDDFCVSGIGLVEHTWTHRRKSALWVFPPGLPPKRVELEAGDMVLLYASSVVHQRTAVEAGERVTTTAIGFSHSHQAS